MHLFVSLFWHSDICNDFYNVSEHLKLDFPIIHKARLCIGGDISLMLNFSKNDNSRFLTTRWMNEWMIEWMNDHHWILMNLDGKFSHFILTVSCTNVLYLIFSMQCVILYDDYIIEYCYVIQTVTCFGDGNPALEIWLHHKNSFHFFLSASTFCYPVH